MGVPVRPAARACPPVPVRAVRLPAYPRGAPVHPVCARLSLPGCGGALCCSWVRLGAVRLVPGGASWGGLRLLLPCLVPSALPLHSLCTPSVRHSINLALPVLSCSLRPGSSGLLWPIPALPYAGRLARCGARCCSAPRFSRGSVTVIFNNQKHAI